MKEINSTQNEKVKSWMKLKQPKYRDQDKLVILEGWHICLEIFNLENCIDLIEQIIINKKEIKRLEEHLNNKNMSKTFNDKVTLVNDIVLDKLTSYKNAQPIMIILNIAKYFELTNKGYDYKKILLLDNIQDPSNLGTICRTALAFEFQKILLVNDCVDLFNAKVLSTSQGAFLKLDIEILKDEARLLELKQSNYRYITTDLHKSATDLEDFNIGKDFNYIYCFGNEGNGLSEKIYNLSDENVLIKINSQLDSISVSQAITIFMYEINKKNKEN